MPTHDKNSFAGQVSSVERIRRELVQFWRGRVRPWWDDYEWPLVGIVALATLGVGYWGFAEHFRVLGESRSPGDLAYLSVQLFVLESGSIGPPIGYSLELARWLAPLIAAYTALQALTVIFAEQLQLLRLRVVRNHVVVCGLGRKGTVLAISFLEAGRQVVVIEKDASRGMLHHCRDRGALIVLGDAAERQVLQKARVDRAQQIIAVCDDDAVNAEVAVRARELGGAASRAGASCIVHISDPQLRHQLREQEMMVPPAMASRLRLEFFNVFADVARHLLNEYPIFSDLCQATGTTPHLLVIGDGAVAEHLVAEAAKEWRRRPTAVAERLPITVAAGSVEVLEAWRSRYPLVATVCRTEVIDPKNVCGGPGGLEAHGPITAVYVCLEQEAKAIATGLEVRRAFPDSRVPVVVCLMEESGLAELLQVRRTDCPGHHAIRVFGLLEQTCNPDLLPGGTHEILARCFHERYRQTQLANGATVEKNAALKPWDQLAAEFQESSRRQADHIGVKLAANSCRIALLTDWNAESFQFSEQEVEILARMEHERWMAERFLEGWHYGETRDDAARVNPNLVAWNDVSLATKAYNREAMKDLPRDLAEAGLQIRRTTAAP
jgi:TrkA-N domain/RyR domain